MFFAQNIKLLRTRKKRSQQFVAESLEISRSNVSAYEIGTSEPNFVNLIKFSTYYKVSIDKLIRTNLSKMTESKLSELERGYEILSNDFSEVDLRKSIEVRKLNL